eukprot:9797391-Heterocapsa_arctica.AAC.1
MGQESVARTVEPIDLSKMRKAQPQQLANPAEIAESRSELRALGWLTTQSQSDLGIGVSLSGKARHARLTSNCLETDKLISQFHGASWANAEEISADFGTMKNPAESGKKPSRLNTRSQAGVTMFICERGIEDRGA